MKTMQPTRIRRRGITLVEVLMSTMVVMLGILGLISLIPLGSHLAERGTRSDRVASISRRVYREAKIRRILDPDAWLDPFKTPPMGATTDQSRFRLSSNSLPVRQPYLIDPMFFIDSTAARQSFPFSSSTPPQMLRLSLGSFNTSFPLMEHRAELAFVSDDDYGGGATAGFVRPKDRENPLEQQFFRREINGVVGLTAADNVRRQSAGTYSWAIMLVPEPSGEAVNLTAGEKAPPFAIATDAKQTPTDTYMMSTIIFHNRAGDIPAAADMATSLNERVLTVEPGSLISGGGTTGEVQLSAATPAMLSMKTGDWICLAARLTSTAAGVTYYLGDVYKWYRIVAMDEIEELTAGTKYGLRVSLDGPDWNANAQQAPSQAIYMQDVVGVYERKVRLETGSPWTP